MKNKQTHKTTIDEINQIMKMKKSGYTYRQIADKVGLSHGAVAYILRKFYRESEVIEGE